MCIFLIGSGSIRVMTSSPARGCGNGGVTNEGIVARNCLYPKSKQHILVLKESMYFLRLIYKKMYICVCVYVTHHTVYIYIYIYIYQAISLFIQELSSR